MKKLLLLFSFVCIVGSGFAQELSHIAGSTLVVSKISYPYLIHFSDVLKEDTRIEVVSVNGRFDDINGPSSTTMVVPRGVNMYYVYVYWLDANFTNGSITVKKESGSSKTVAISNIKRDQTTTKPPSSYEITTTGPLVISVGDAVSYVSKLKPSLNDAHKYIWTNNEYLDNTRLDKVSNQVTALVVARKPVKNLKLPVSIVDKSSGAVIQNVDYLITILPSYSISATNSPLCSNETAKFSIKGMEQTPGAVVNWIESANMKLVSGQGTPNAVFRASGSGIGVVNATVGGIASKQYSIWIGPPTPNYIQTQIGNNNVLFVNTPNYNDGIATWTYGNIADVKKYEWSVNGWNVVRHPMSDSDDMSAVRFIASSPSSVAYIKVRANNVCGWGPYSDLKTVSVSYTKSAIEAVEVSDLSGSSSIRIYSLTTGSVVYTEKNIMNFNIENTGLKKGIYVLEKTDGEGNVTRIKVAKQ